MADFTSGVWGLYVAGLITFGLLFCIVVLVLNMTTRESGEPKLQGHVWDETLREYNNPLPKWWLWLFWGTLAFAIVYFIKYPGFGTFNDGKGLRAEYAEDIAAVDGPEGLYGKEFSKFKGDLVALSQDPAAEKAGRRLFLTYCANCHGVAGTGGSGFPDLTDNDWLYGSDAATIKESIADGRSGAMTAAADLGLNGQQIEDAANYVLFISDQKEQADLASAARGKLVFLSGTRNEDGSVSYDKCAMCHGANGKGSVINNNGLGAPDLTDGIWLYGSSKEAIVDGITKGRNVGNNAMNAMPTWKEFLSEDKIHVLAAYVYGLSNKK
ncbi:MAG: cytochrome-c oxidase, cbb3-type subunit III [Azoarcus sp.]|jgi:cytochrome c oxidase cbb3-type subunit 3|nr:cytochrome-c oxidase, cbb3-type subunit III [Azoarcus sp.]